MDLHDRRTRGPILTPSPHNNVGRLSFFMSDMLSVYWQSSDALREITGKACIPRHDKLKSLKHSHSTNSNLSDILQGGL